MNLLGGLLSFRFIKDDSEYKSGFAAIMVLLAVSSFTGVRGKHGQCPDCTGGQYIKVIDPATGKCESCWPCTVCQEGTGSSVRCGSVVPRGIDIHCVPCVKGINFSSSSSTEQCQPCGVCSRKHERVSAECTLFSNLKCKCETGFYRNKTTTECQTCDTCCSSDEDNDIVEKCQKDAENKEDEQLLVSSSFTVISTSSSAVKSSTFHVAPTPSLSSSTKIMPVPSKPKLIHPTTESVLSVYERHSVPSAELKIDVNLKHVEIMKWIKGLTCSVGVLALICVSDYFLNPKLKKFRERGQINHPSQQSYRFSTLNQHDQENPILLKGAGTSSRRSDTDGPIRSTDAINCTEDNEDDEVMMICNQYVQKTEMENFQRGIPISTGGKPRSSIPEDLFPAVSKSVQNHMEGIPPTSPHSVDTGLQQLSRSEGNDNNHDLIIFSGTPSFPEETTCDSSLHLEHNTPFVNCIVHMHHPTIYQACTSSFSPQSWPPSLAEIVKNNSLSPGLDQPVRVAVSWSELSQNERYSTRILEMPFKLLYDMCLSLDIPRTDGKDIRMLADKLGITGRNFDRLKQAAITDNSNNPISYVLLKESFDAVNGTVGDFVDIMNEIGRRDIVDDINDWPG
ncbi:uncharacterized protein LOC111324496 isoform X2 [Stylophora pistillata]|nr:uncharacterized protein LOC111324496 isoform X2 [Stylophora pistillata]